MATDSVVNGTGSRGLCNRIVLLYFCCNMWAVPGNERSVSDIQGGYDRAGVKWRRPVRKKRFRVMWMFCRRS